MSGKKKPREQAAASTTWWERNFGEKGPIVRISSAIVAVCGAVAAVIGVVATLTPNDEPTPQPTTSVSPLPTTQPATSFTASPTTADVPTSWKVEDNVLHLTASYESGAPSAGSIFLMPPGAVTPASWPNNLKDPDRFAREHGGIPAGLGWVRLVVRTDSIEPVEITSIRPRIVNRLTPLQASYAMRVVYGCGFEPVREAVADFDRNPPKVVYYDGTGQHQPTGKLALSVSKADPEIIDVSGTTRQQVVQWEVVIDYQDAAGRTGSLVVGEPDNPFTVTDIPAGTPVWELSGTEMRKLEADADPYGGFC